MKYISRILESYSYTRRVIFPFKIIIIYLIGGIGRLFSLDFKKVSYFWNIFSGPQFFDTPFGKYITYDFSNGYYFMMKDYEGYIQEIIDRGVRTHETYDIIDIGAHIGRHAIGFAYKHPQINVYAFEPHPETFKQLNINVQLSSVEERVVCYNYGLGSQNIGMSFEDNEASSGTNKFGKDNTNHGVIVQVRKFDDMNLDIDIEKIGAIIIDVEGYQLETLQGMHHALMKLRKDIDLIIEINPGDPTKDQVIEYLKQFHYTSRQISKFDYLFKKNTSR